MKFPGFSKVKEWFGSHDQTPSTEDRELMSKMLFIATELAPLPLQIYGAVPPFGVTLNSRGEDSSICFPLNQTSGARWADLLADTTKQLRQLIASNDVGAIAIAAELEADNQQNAVGIQLETRTSAVFLIYPYIGTGRDRTLGTCGVANGLLVTPLLAKQKN